jgi:hypothetical protein
VIDIGSRQKGRERGKNVLNVPATQAALQRAIKKIWNGGQPCRFGGANPYGSGDAGSSIADCLLGLDISRHVRKLISY